MNGRDWKREKAGNCTDGEGEKGFLGRGGGGGEVRKIGEKRERFREESEVRVRRRRTDCRAMALRWLWNLPW